MGALEILASQLKSELITLPQWEAGVRDWIKQEYSTAMILQMGGRENVTQADWGYVGSAVKKQYGYLGNFASDIASEPEKWMTGNRLDGRLKLYNQSGYTALEDFKERAMRLAGWTEERNRLGEADHCSGEGNTLGCLEVTGLGWRKIGELPKVGERLCRTNCKCSMEYRKPQPGGGWVYEKDV